MSIFYIPNTGNSLPHIILDKIGIRGIVDQEFHSQASEGKSGTSRATLINFKVWTTSRAELSHSRLYTMNLTDTNGRQICVAAIMKINVADSDCEPVILSSHQTQSLLTILAKCKNIWNVRQQAALQLIHNPKFLISHGFLNFNGNERGLILFYSPSPLYARNDQIEEDFKEEDDSDKYDKSIENFILEASKSISSSAPLENVNISEEKMFQRYTCLGGDQLRDLLMALRDAL